MSELKPCPFCGGKPVIMANSVVECRNCPTGKYCGYPSADIAAWNRRAAPVVTKEMEDRYIDAVYKIGQGEHFRESVRVGLTAALEPDNAN